jgi:putative sigma-54 modulation protein
MRLELRARGIQASARLRRQIEERVRFALRRFGDRVRRVRVHLWDVNGPRGGEDIRVRILATVAGPGAGAHLVIQERHTRPLGAVGLACERVAHTLARRLGRIRARRRDRRGDRRRSSDRQSSDRRET